MEPRRKWLALALGAVSALLIALSVPALVVPAQDSAGIAPASLEAARPDGDAFGSASAPSAEIDETAEETGGDGTGPQERPPASDVAAAAAAPSSGAASESPGAADGADGAAESPGAGGPADEDGAAAPAPSPEDSGGSSGAEERPAQVTVWASVSSDAVGNPVSAASALTLPEGPTPYDALRALGVSVSAEGGAFGTYVSAIGGLAEKDHGASSGWMYAVNGRVAGVACDQYALADGDTVEWYYVV